jgi:predicted metal-dependent hydrolase
MSTANAYLTVRGIGIDVIYKDIKNLHIGVYPPTGRVRVAAPRRFDDEQVRLAVVERLSWIKKQREQLQTAERQSERMMVSGETHYVWGRRHRLRLIVRPGRTHLEVDGDRLLMYAPEETTEERRRELLELWYREQLRRAVPDVITKWEPVIGIAVPKWTIRRMKTKWGSCNRESRHIWFNVELAKKHPESLEYIVVHEMTHYLDRGHGRRFTTLMDGFMPDWSARRDRLNAAPLAAEKWHDPRA